MDNSNILSNFDSTSLYAPLGWCWDHIRHAGRPNDEYSSSLIKRVARTTAGVLGAPFSGIVAVVGWILPKPAETPHLLPDLAPVAISSVSHHHQGLDPHLLDCLGFKLFDPQKTYKNGSEDWLSDADITNTSPKLLFETREGYVLDFRLIIFHLLQGDDFARTFPKVNAPFTLIEFCKSPKEFNALIKIAKYLESIKEIPAEDVQNLEKFRDRMLRVKQHLLTLKIKECIGLPKQARYKVKKSEHMRRIIRKALKEMREKGAKKPNIKRGQKIKTNPSPVDFKSLYSLSCPFGVTVSLMSESEQSLLNYLSVKDTQLFLENSMKESTINQLSHLSAKLDKCDHFGKAVLLSDFVFYMEDLRKYDLLEYLRLGSVNLHELFKTMPARLNLPYMAYHGRATGSGFRSFLNQTYHGIICVNDEFRPSIACCFGLLHLVSLSDEITLPFYEQVYD